MKRRQSAIGGAGAAAAALLVTGCGASTTSDADFPSDTIEIIVPWAAGGSSDVMVRAFTEPFQEELGESVLVVNRPGGGSAVGAAEAANANGDGYTVLHSTSSTFVTVPLRQPVRYTPDDFRTFTALGDQPIVLVADADTGWESLDDAADFDGERMQVGATSIGNVLHLVASNFVDEAGMTSEAIPFDGSNEVVMAVANGDVDLAGVEANIAIPQIEAGEVVPLAVSSDERVDALPEVQTFGEQGYDRSQGRLSRVALSVPSDTPEEIYEALSTASAQALESESWKEYAASTNLIEPEFTGDEWMTEFVPNEVDWTRESFGPAGVEEEGSAE